MARFIVKPTDDGFGVYAGDAAPADQPRFTSPLETSADAVCAFMNEGPVQEYGNSLDDFTTRVRRAFERLYKSPDSYEMSIWVTDVFTDHVVAREKDRYFSIPFTQEGETITFAPRDQWQQVMLDYVPVTETLQPDSVPCHIAFVSEFTGTPPDVPLAAGVDRELLERLPNGDPDPNPMYLTLEIARTGAVSGNKFRHTPGLVTSVVEQINQNKPTGIMGHIKPQDRATSFPVADIHWVGAIELNGSAYGKGYLPAGRADVREYYRAEKAKGGKAATSMYGGGPKQTYENGEWSVSPFRMESLDLAPWTRAAWPGPGQFQLTSEMVHDDPPPTQPDESIVEETTMDWSTITYDDLPETVIEMVRQHTPPPAPPATPEPALVAEMDALRNTNTTLNTRVQELENRLAEQAQREFNLLVDALVSEFTDWDTRGMEAAETAVSQLRANFRTVLVAEYQHTRDDDDAPDLKAVAETVWNTSFTGLAGAIRDMLSGGPARIGGRMNNQRRNVEEPTPDQYKAARAKAGF